MFLILIVEVGTGEWAYVIENIMRGETTGFHDGYPCRCSCEEDVNHLLAVCHKESSYERHDKTRRDIHFSIVDHKKEQIMLSMGFIDENQREDEIAAIKQYLPQAEIIFVEPSLD